MTRIDYLNDPNAPRANRIVPAASAIIINSEGNILLQQRSDTFLWSLPGGTMEIGESIAETIIREVKEETGLDVVPEYIIGTYTNPKHVVAFSDGEVRQQFSICFACKLVGGEIHVSEESLAVVFFSSKEIEQLPMHESTRLRINHYLEYRTRPVIA